MRLADRIVDLSTRPVPLRSLIARRLLQRFPIGSWPARIRAGAVGRPYYSWCVYHSALLAKALGHRAITVVEFGVAGGNGLVYLCEDAARVRRELGIEVRPIGFDAGGGLPATADFRDLRYAWPAGSFPMDRAALEKRLAGRAQLILGDVAKTLPLWEPPADAPLAAVCFDLDLYSSTREALPVLTRRNVLPRIWCYFDDIRGYPHMALTDFIGEGAAVREFNEHPSRSIERDNISPAWVFRSLPPEDWHQKMFMYHRLNHPQYNTCLSEEKHQLTLAAA